MAGPELIEMKVFALVKVICCILDGLAAETDEPQNEWWEAMQGKSLEAVQETTGDLCQEITSKLWEKHVKQT